MEMRCTSPNERMKQGSLIKLSLTYPYFPRHCVHGGESNLTLVSAQTTRQWDGLGHVLLKVLNGLFLSIKRDDPDEQRRHFFDEDVTPCALYLRDFLGRKAVYCHQPRDWRAISLHQHGSVSFHDTFPNGTALISHLECYLTPDLDTWFALAAGAQRAKVLRSTAPKDFSLTHVHTAVAESYKAISRDKMVPCGRRADDIVPTVALHVRGGDRLDRGNMIEWRPYVARLGHALRILAKLPPGTAFRMLVVTEAAPGKLLELLKAFSILAAEHATWHDGVAQITRVETRTLGVSVPFDILNGGHPLVALHCLVSSDVLLKPTSCKKSDGSCSTFHEVAQFLRDGPSYAVPTQWALLGGKPRLSLPNEATSKYAHGLHDVLRARKRNQANDHLV